ncbi:MAG TPA: recombinase family protein [Symbiobacteriaceae bacterium]
MSLGPKPIDGRKVAVYIRWSTDDQGDGTTLDVQLAGCQHYVLSQGWQVNDELTIVDDGYSGGNLDRPGLTRLRQLVRQGKVDCVVVFKVDRLSRSVIDTVNLVLEEWDGRTYMKSAREPIDTTTAMGKQFFYMLVSYAEWERSVIRERTVSGRRRRAEDGYKPSSVAPYGYCHAASRRGALELVPTEAEIVREIFRLCNSGLGGKTIANTFNRRGTHFRNQSLWSETTITYMLHNRIYVGDMVYGKTTRNPRYGKEPGEMLLLKAEPLVVENSTFIPPIVSRDEFGLAQEMLTRRMRGPGKPSGRSNSSPYLLSGIAKCRCGYGFFAKRETTPKGAFNYVCIGKKIHGGTRCDCAPIPMAQLDREIERRVKERFGSALAQEGFMRSIMAGREQLLRLKAAELVEADRLLAAVGEQLKKVSRDYRLDRITAEEYRGLKAEIEAEAQETQAQRSSLEADVARLDAEAREDLVVKEYLARIDQWDALEVTERKNILRFFVSQLVAYRRPKEQGADVNLEWISLGQEQAGT